MPSLIENTIAEHLGELQGFVHKRIGDQELARDVLQDSLAKAIAKADTIRDQDKLLPWLYAILRNTIINSYSTQACDQKKWML